MKFFQSSLLFVFALLLSAVSLNAQNSHGGDSMMKKEAMMKKAKPTVIQISQTEGQYNTKSLNLLPGDYIFEVTNLDVDKELGFYLQDTDEAQVKRSGLKSLVGKGQTSRTGVVTLTEGSYNYSCPINPTPHYSISVGEPRVVQLNQIEGQYETSGLNLTAGYYIFEVSNLEVDKELGFYLQDASEAQVENSGLQELVGNGKTSRTGVVFLAPGQYNYSCPLNPTPHYSLNVR